MKKTFKLTHEKTATPRLVEAIKHEVNKYLKRERRRAFPADIDADFWDFDCRFGADAESSKVIHVSEINKYISQAETDELESFYLEILAKPVSRTKKPVVIEEDDDFDDELEVEFEDDFEGDSYESDSFDEFDFDIDDRDE